MARVQHSCTGCVPIDASIIDVYIQLLGLKDSTIEAAERAEYAAEHAIGKSPYIGENGDWWEWNDEHGVFIDTMVQAHSSIAVDTQLDPNSTNPVQNKVTTQALAGKQETLVSGTNIKTVNGESLLGSGNIVAGDPNAVKYTEQTLTDSQMEQARSNIGAGTYSKAGSGIPKNDLSSAVQTSLGKADTAIQDISGKQDVITDLATIRSGAAAGATAYQKPGTGIPSTDMASAVQTSLGKADTAYQKPSGGVPKSDLASSVQTSISKADTAIQPAEFNELEEEVRTIGNGAYEEAWDGSSAPVVADIPAGVSVTYNSTSYTGTLAASASTVDKIYLVSDGNGNYDRYTTVEANGAYSWKKVGSTAIPLSNYATETEVSQLRHEVTADVSQLEAEVTDLDSTVEEVVEYTGTLIQDDSVNDFSIEDEDGNTLLAINDGELETSAFESAKTPSIADDDTNDFSIVDEEGNPVLSIKDGQIKTSAFDSSNCGGKTNLPYQRRTYFQVDVDCSPIIKDNYSTAVGINTSSVQAIYNDNVVLYLPTTYTQNGTPTKLVIYCKHGDSKIEQSSDPIGDNFDGNIMRYLLSLGYAVMGADGVPDSFASAIGICERVVGNYIAVQSTIKAFEYVCSNYNIDSGRVFLYGYSQGGHYAQNLIDLSSIPFACAAEVSPVCSMRYHQWDLAASGTIGGVYWTRLARLNIARLFGFNTVSNDAELLALSYDGNKVVGYDPWVRNVEGVYTGFTQNSIYGNNLWSLPGGTSLDNITMKKSIKCPVKIWCAENDPVLGADVMKVFVKAIKNAGCVADMTLYSTGGHQIQSSQTSIGTYSENGETLNLYPLAKDIAIWFGKFGGNNLI